MSTKRHYLRVTQSNGIARRCKLIFDNAKKVLAISSLPKEYQEVEYLESSGTQWIDTGLKANQNTTVEIFFNTAVRTAAQFLFGNRITNTRAAFGALLWNSNKIYSEYNNSGNIITTFVYQDKTNCCVMLSKNKLIINGIVYTTHTPATFQTEGNMSLFGITTQSPSRVFDTSQSLAGKVYYCKIYNNNTLVRDFVPCFRKSDNVIGMYDKVNNTFYTNAGTGTFIKGKNV